MEYRLKKGDILAQLLEQRSVVEKMAGPILSSFRVSSISKDESERLVRMTNSLYTQIPYIVYHSLQQDASRKRVLINYLGENYEIKVRLV